MFSQTMLALTVALVLYGLYRLCRSSVANARGERAPALPHWQRLLVQPHLMSAPPSTASAADTEWQRAQGSLRDDIARSPLDAIARRRLMGELDACQRDAAARPGALASIRERFAQAQAQASAAPAVDDQAQQSIRALRTALEQREGELVALQQQLDALQAPTSLMAGLETSGEADEDDIADPFDPVPGKDDLRAIQGIGKRMQRLLNGLGVTTFAQLAAFERSHIEQVAQKLEGSRDNIEAENWVGQARELLARRRRTHEQG